MKYRTLGLPRLAVVYWRNYIQALVGMLFWMLIFGALAAVATLLYVPEAISYLGYSILGLAVHGAAFFLRDFWTGEIDLGEAVTDVVSMTWTEIGLVMSAIAVYLSFILFAGGLVGHALQVAGVSGYLVVGGALYYATADLYLMRKTTWSPGGIVLRLALYCGRTLGILKGVEFGQLPIVQPRRRMQEEVTTT